MATRKYTDTDLSHEEPTHRADLGMERVDLEVGTGGVRLRSTLRSNSPIARAVQCLLLAIVILGLPAGAGAVAMWLGLGPVVIGIFSGTGLVAAVGIVAFVYKKPGADADRQEPASRPPAQRRNRKTRRGKNNSRR
ncbi:hypothetical protein [Streptomyces spororaveus]|uniref:Superfamily III holin-X n=1 Tax=Streptomyces spororaveus TaxID=284039 RepID=A0ABQ3T495_9ACTN|nr:hypothetical protein [Streptomyces spororaveus]MCM9077288.1 hypothetical protein [Streptomyces spororaveus]GHI74820.1 hypothetical protein Sspor_03810 [Streptomyces spororaveus]